MYLCAMKKIKSNWVSLLFVLLTFINISFLSVNSSLLNIEQQTSQTIDRLNAIAHNTFIPNPNLENTLISFFERINKHTSNPCFPFPFTTHKIFDPGYISSGTPCHFITDIVWPGLSSFDIIFPFHNFW